MAPLPPPYPLLNSMILKVFIIAPVIVVTKVLPFFMKTHQFFSQSYISLIILLHSLTEPLGYIIEHVSSFKTQILQRLQEHVVVIRLLPVSTVVISAVVVTENSE